MKKRTISVRLFISERCSKNFLYEGELTVSLFIVDDNQVEQIHGMSAEYPYCMIISDMTAFTVPWHWHEEMEILLIGSGYAKVTTDDEEHILTPGQGFILNQNVMHSIHSVEDKK